MKKVSSRISIKRSFIHLNKVSDKVKGKHSGGGERFGQRKERAAVYPSNEPSISSTKKISGRELPRAEEEASDRTSIETSSISSYPISARTRSRTSVHLSFTRDGQRGFLGRRREPRAEERTSSLAEQSLVWREEPTAVYQSNEPSLSSRDQTSGRVLPRTEVNASRRVSIGKSSYSYIIHLGQSAQLYICQFTYLGRRGLLGRRRPSRAEARARGEQPYVDRYTINLINNSSRTERAAVHLSANHPSNSETVFPRAEENISGKRRKEPSGEAERLGQRKGRTAICSSSASSISSGGNYNTTPRRGRGEQPHVN